MTTPLVHPKFGDWIRGIYAGEENPTRDGMFVRVHRRTGKFNPGVFYTLTDGKGKFWDYWAKDTIRIDPPKSAEALAGDGGEALARQFHETYERLAPSFGYETREATRQFDPESPNGRLMIAVCNELSTPSRAGGGEVVAVGSPAVDATSVASTVADDLGDKP